MRPARLPNYPKRSGRHDCGNGADPRIEKIASEKIGGQPKPDGARGSRQAHRPLIDAAGKMGGNESKPEIQDWLVDY